MQITRSRDRPRPLSKIATDDAHHSFAKRVPPVSLSQNFGITKSPRNQLGMVGIFTICRCSCWFSVSRHSKQIKIKIKTVQQINSRIQEMKGGTYTKTLAKIQVRGIFRIRDIRRNVLPKLIEFVWRRHAGAHLDELQHGGRKPTETFGTEFATKA